MRLDKILDFLFRRACGIFISATVAVLAVFLLSGCFCLDTLGGICGTCGATDCRDSCVHCSEESDSTCHTCFGGYNADCAPNDCLFGLFGCNAECGSCYIDCGGLNYSCYDANDGCDTHGCYTSEEGYRRFDCSNCTVYCAGSADPDSPNYSTVKLHDVTLYDTNGDAYTFTFYQGTDRLPKPKTPVEGLDFIGYFSATDGGGTKYCDENGKLLSLPEADAKLYPHYADKYADNEYYVTVWGLPADGTMMYTEKASFIIKSGESIYDKLPAYTDIAPYTFRGWTSSAYQPSQYMMSNGTDFYEDFAIFDPDMYEILYMDGTLEVKIREVYDGVYLY